MRRRLCGNDWPDGVYVEQRRKRLLFTGTTAEVIGNYFALDHPLGKSAVRSRTIPRCAQPAILRGPADHSATALGMSGDIYYLIDETGGAYSSDLADACESDMENVSGSLISRSTRSRPRVGSRTYRARFAGVRTRLPGEEPAGDGAPHCLRRSSISNNGVSSRTNHCERVLCELPGVGAKVANCVMLFAYERLRAFPIDVWIERVLKQKYFPRKRKVTATQLRAFCETYFGEHGGYAQQYLFHHARKGGAAPRGAAK